MKVAAVDEERAPAEAFPSEEGASLNVLLRHVWTHVGLVLSICVAVVVVVLFATLTTRPEYEGQVRLLLESSAPKVVDVERVVEPRFETDVYLKTQIQIIKSRALANRVISALNLEGHKEFQPDSSVFWDWYQDGYLKLRGAIQSWFQRIFASGDGSSPEGPEDKQNALVDNFLSRLGVTPVRGTRLLTVSFRGYYPEAVAAIANAVADQFIEQTLEFEFSSARRATKWLEGQLAELKKAAERSERVLQAYRQAENLVGVEVAESPEVITGALGTLSRGIMEARSERIAAEAAYREFKSYLGRDRAEAKLESIPSGLLGGDTLITNLQINLADVQREYANLSRRYRPKHPAMVQLRSKVEFLKRRLRREISQAVKKLETRFVVAQQRERSLMASLEKEKARVIQLGGKTVKLGILKREVESNRKLYELFLTRMKETNLATNLRMTNIQIVDRAAVPDAPVRPRRGRNLILAMVLGLFLGVGVAFGVEHFDTSLRDPDETERILGIPVMATVDHMRKLTKKTGELVVLEKGSSEYAVNFFNTLRTNLLYSAPAEERRVLLVTSSTPEEGKTFLASNLALALANLGEEVLLIDADLRHPRVHDLFGLDKEPGLTDFLVGRNALEEVLHATGRNRLSLIPAGHYSPNPADLLSSDQLEGLFKELQGRFQYIVVDSPPVLSVADPLTLVPRVNGVIVVTWAGRTPGRHVIQALRKLKDVRDSRVFFGLVMNRIVHRRGSSQYYYYHRRYRYYYSKGQ